MGWFQDAASAYIGGIPGYIASKTGLVDKVKDKLGLPSNLMDLGKQKADPANAKLEDGAFMRDYIKQQMGGLNGRPVPRASAASINTGPQNQWRDREMSLADQLQKVASGQQMGAGEMAIRRGMNQAAAAQQAQAAMARGGMAGIAGRSAARNLGNLSVDAAGQGAQAALQDQGAARNLLAGVLGQGRGADIGIATNQAGLNQQTSLANQDAELKARGMDDQARLAYLAQMHGISVAEMQARLAQEAANMGQTGILPDLLQAGGALGGAAIMASDRSLKTDVAEAGEAVDDLLDSLDPVRFRYVEPAKHGDGEYAGILAQDAQRTDLGREMVLETPDGLMLDAKKTVGVLLAAVARLNQRVRELEAR